MAFLISIGGRALARRGRSGKLLILRWTPGGSRGLRLDTPRSCRISSSRLFWNRFLCRGGTSLKDGKLAADNAHGIQERQSVRMDSAYSALGMICDVPVRARQSKVVVEKLGVREQQGRCPKNAVSERHMGWFKPPNRPRQGPSSGRWRGPWAHRAGARADEVSAVMAKALPCAGSGAAERLFPFEVLQ